MKTLIALRGGSIIILLACLAAGCGQELPSTPPAPATAAQPDSRPALFAIHVDGKTGFIDERGIIVIPPVYDFANTFGHDDLTNVRQGRQWGMINTSGEVVIPLEYEQIMGSAEGLIRVKKNGLWGYIDQQGREVIPPRYEDCGGFAGGLACCLQQGKYGYIDRQGNMVIAPRFDAAEPFWQGLARVKVGDQFGYIDRTGAFVWQPTK